MFTGMAGWSPGGHPDPVDRRMAPNHEARAVDIRRAFAWGIAQQRHDSRWYDPYPHRVR
jgi:hypothetical protein